MSIKPIDEVPGIAGKPSYNDKIRADFNEAIEKHIEKFEFEKALELLEKGDKKNECT